MAAKKFDRGSEEWTMLADFNRIQSDCWIAELTEDYLETVKDNCIAFRERFKNYDYAYADIFSCALMDLIDMRINVLRTGAGGTFKCSGHEYKVLENGNVELLR